MQEKQPTIYVRLLIQSVAEFYAYAQTPLPQRPENSLRVNPTYSSNAVFF